jgi:OFA family oxalate/formate antiporter-like MFS transporter
MSASVQGPVLWRSRWPQLTFAVLSTVMLANMQYGWTLFVNPMHDANGWSRASIQVAFTIMIFVNTWLSPLEGWLVDRYGPRPVVMVGAVCAAISWVMNSEAHSLSVLYLSAIVGGLATAAPLALMIQQSGYRHAFRFFGVLQGAAILFFALLLIKPAKRAEALTARKRIYQGAELTPPQTLRTRVFWLIYLIYLLIAFGGMIITAQLGPIARDFGVETRTVTILGLSTPVLALAVSLDNFANGITRPVCGFLSDILGRENMMLLVFSLESLALLGAALFGSNPYSFVLFMALVFLFWGEIFVVFPAVCGDSFGIRHATANNGLLYTAKGTAALTVPLANLLTGITGTWTSVLFAAAACSLLAGVLAKFALVPMRKRLVLEYCPAEIPVSS